jgi:hypothetical protein
MFFYAQLDDNSICTCIAALHSKVDKSNLVEIESYDSSILGKRFENGIFIEIPKSKEQLLEELKGVYLSQIKDADLLGDIEEKERLQQEYQQKKAELEAQFTTT